MNQRAIRKTYKNLVSFKAKPNATLGKDKGTRRIYRRIICAKYIERSTGNQMATATSISPTIINTMSRNPKFTSSWIKGPGMLSPFPGPHWRNSFHGLGNTISHITDKDRTTLYGSDGSTKAWRFAGAAIYPVSCSKQTRK